MNRNQGGACAWVLLAVCGGVLALGVLALAYLKMRG